MCPVEEKAKIDICESDQWVADFDSANFGLACSLNKSAGDPSQRALERLLRDLRVETA